jgi:hypothetical protein
MITFPLWFKIYLAFAAYCLLSLVLMLRSKNRTLKRIRAVPAEKKERIRKAYVLMLTCYRIFLWAIPLHSVLIPWAIYVWDPKGFFHTTLAVVLADVVAVVEFRYRRAILMSMKTWDTVAEET